MTDTVTLPVETDVELPQDIPPAWANSLMRWAITTPVIQAMVGQGVALLTFTGRRSGKTYRIPVSYERQGDTVTVISKKVRNWWRNFENPREVQIRLAGTDYIGKAEAHTDPSQIHDYMVEYLEKRPIDAKAYGLRRDEITHEKVARILPGIVLIRIQVTPVTGPSEDRPGE
ncbi:MAG: nitroreductase/quinone reductase family protein [Acidimicrobiia bacterium]